MRKSQILFVTMFLLTMCVSAFAADVQQSATPAGVVNINSADAAQIAYLPRVGMKAAQRVVEYRTQHGPFRQSTDIMQVKGFGDKTYQRISSYITVDGKTTLSAKVRGPRKARAKASRHTASPTSTASK